MSGDYDVLAELVALLGIQEVPFAAEHPPKGCELPTDVPILPGSARLSRLPGSRQRVVIGLDLLPEFFSRISCQGRGVLVIPRRMPHAVGWGDLVDPEPLAAEPP